MATTFEVEEEVVGRSSNNSSSSKTNLPSILGECTVPALDLARVP